MGGGNSFNIFGERHRFFLLVLASHVVLAAATGAVAATGAPPAVRLVAAAAPRAARVLVTALR